MILIVRMNRRCWKKGKVTKESGEVEHKSSRMTGLMKKNFVILSKDFFNIETLANLSCTNSILTKKLNNYSLIVLRNVLLIRLTQLNL